jgi:hypothetical protein
MSRKANEKMALLKDALKLEFPSFTLTESFVSGDPALLVSEDATPAVGEEVAYVKMVQKSYTGFPQISLASTEDGRAHTLQVVVEESASAGISVWTTLDLSRLIARLAQMNVHMELYMSANTDLPADGEITTGNLKGEIRSDVRHPNSGD